MFPTNDYVFVRTTFEGYHRWKDAPDGVLFLRDWHRHILHVELGVKVSHDNRQVEFIQLKWKLDGFINKMWKDKQFEDSCEMIARSILINLNGVWCEVSEDGENGAYLEAKED